MPQQYSRYIKHYKLWVSLVIFLIMGMGLPTFAQEGTSVTFTGLVSEVTQTTIIVGGVSVDITNAVLPVGGVTAGMSVQVIGVAEGQTIRATVIVLISTPALTPIGTIAPTDPIDPDPIETVEVTETATPQPPIIIGDAPIIVIEGPVQAINITSITIFDINIEVDPADVILTQIRIGDTIRVQGQSSIENNTIIIVAINITIVETTIIVINNPGTIYVPVGLPANCKRTKKGKVTCKRT